MSVQELTTRINAAKRFLNAEMNKIKTGAPIQVFSYRELGEKLDQLHEAERIGLRKLDERGIRKVSKILSTVEGAGHFSEN